MSNRRSLFNSPDDAAYALHALSSTADNGDHLERLRESLFFAMQHNLTDRQREALLFHYAQGLKLAEIAALWGVSVSAVSRHISRGKKKLMRVVPPV